MPGFGSCNAAVCPSSMFCVLGPYFEDALCEGLGIDLRFFEFIFVTCLNVSLVVAPVLSFHKLVGFVVRESFGVSYLT